MSNTEVKPVVINLNEKITARLQQLYAERQRINEICDLTLSTIIESNNIDFGPDKRATVAQDFKTINIEPNESV